MKIYWDDRGTENLPKPYYVTMKQAAISALKHCFEAENISKLKYELNISFAGDEEMRELNNRYREKDKPTDVLSFRAMNTPAPDDSPCRPCGSGIRKRIRADKVQTAPLGDIVIGTSVAARQAEEYGHSLERELAFLVVHGVLHLLGLDHETDPGDEAIMEEIQAGILAELGLLHESES